MNPFAVGMKVMSATQNWFGPAAVKSRSTRSGAGRASFFASGCRHAFSAPTGPGQLRNPHQARDAFASVPVPYGAKRRVDPR
jgi:hypothetical protein